MLLDAVTEGGARLADVGVAMRASSRVDDVRRGAGDAAEDGEQRGSAWFSNRDSWSDVAADITAAARKGSWLPL